MTVQSLGEYSSRAQQKLGEAMPKLATGGKRQKRKQPQGNGSGTIALPALADEHLDISTLETWLWDAACAIRGATDAPKFKDFILPLIFFKRLSDVFDDEFSGQVKEFGDEDIAREVIKADHEDALKSGRKPVVRFFIPHEYRWDRIRNHPADGALGQFVTDAMRDVARLNPDLQGVLDIKDYNERQSGQRTLDDDRLATLIEVISRHRLGLKNAEPDILGRAYEYLLRKFAEGQGQSAGEFYTPKEVGWLMAHLIDAQPYRTVYDPTCGSAGLLIKCRLLFEQKHPQQKSKAPRLYGQELNPVTFAMAKMNMFLHDYTDSLFAIGDTFTKPGFVAEGAGLKRFDYVVANPMWNQPNYKESFYDNDQWKRFSYGTPPDFSADWGWLQHIAASLNDNGRAAVVLDTSAVSRGSDSKSSNKEKTIRQTFVEADLIEGVVLLPEDLFYNTPAAGIIIVLNSNKPPERKRQILLVNTSAYFIKGKPKNALTDEGVAAVTEVFSQWKAREKLSHVATIDDVREADYNLSPSFFVDINNRTRHRLLGPILNDLVTARKEQGQAIDRLMESVNRTRVNLEKPTEDSVAARPQGWRVERLGAISSIRYGLGQPPKFDESGVPMIRATDIKSGRLISEGVIRVDKNAIPASRNPYLQKGDIIVVRSGAYTGDVVMYDGRWDAAIAGYDLVVSPDPEQVDSNYLTQYLLSESAQRYFRSLRDRAAQPHLNAQQLADVLVPIPNLEEQREIANLLSACTEHAASLETGKSLTIEFYRAVREELFTGRLSVCNVEESQRK